MSLAVTASDRDSLDIWKRVQLKLKDEYGEATYKSWLSKINFVSTHSGTLTLIAPTKFMREWVITHYLENIKDLWRSFDSSIYDLEINIASANSNIISSASGNEINLNIYEEKNVTEINNFYQNYDLTSTLDDRFTFNNFVVGAPNEFAYAAARSVAESSTTEAKTNP